MEPTPLVSRWRSWFALDPLDNRYPALHGLRFVAILSVVQYHLTGFFGRGDGGLDRSFVTMSLRLFFGMDLFFILSGFLIGTILLHSLDRDGTQRVGRFYVRRIFRTFPPYYLVLTWLAMTKVLTPTETHNLPYEYAFLTNFTELANTGLVMGWGWSLALEEQFYLAAPLLFWALHRLPSDRARILTLVGLWALGLVIRLAIFSSQESWTNADLLRATYFRTYTRFDTIVCGILLAVVHRRYGPRIAGWLVHPFHRAILALPALGLLWLLLTAPTGEDPDVLLLRMFLWGTVTCLMYFPTLLLLLHTDTRLTRALSWPIFRTLATLGYGVYLVHIPVLERVAPLMARLSALGLPQSAIWAVTLVVAMVLSLALGYVLHLVVEKPALRLRQRLAG